MCAIEDCESWEVVTVESRRARREHVCTECRRIIRAGETYRYVGGLTYGGWSSDKTCQHCEAMAGFMHVMCNGYPIGRLHEELVEHFRDGYASIPLGRLIACMRLKWHDGADPVPEHAGNLARDLMRKAVS